MKQNLIHIGYITMILGFGFVLGQNYEAMTQICPVITEIVEVPRTDYDILSFDEKQLIGWCNINDDLLRD